MASSLIPTDDSAPMFGAEDLYDLLKGSEAGSRTVFQCQKISTLLKDHSFFRLIPDESVLALSMNIAIRYFREQQVLFKEGSSGQTFYIIHRGRCAVFRQDQTHANSPDYEFMSENERSINNEEHELQQDYGGFITALLAEDVFGEQQQYNPRHARTATVVATSADGVDVLVVHGSDFEKYIMPHGKGPSFYSWKRCRDILNCNPKYRTIVEVKLVAKFARDCVTFFSQLSLPLCLRLVKYASLEIVNASSTIFHSGEEGKHFYVIMSGEVTVFKEDKILAILRTGDAFGEKALLSHEPRSASTKASDSGPVELMVISEDDYHTVLEPLMSWSKNRFTHVSMLQTNLQTSIEILNIPPAKRNSTHISQLNFFLNHLPFFKQLPGKLTQRICHMVTLRKARQHEILMHQGDDGDAFYIILKGSVSVHVQKDQVKYKMTRAKLDWRKSSKNSKRYINSRASFTKASHHYDYAHYHGENKTIERVANRRQSSYMKVLKNAEEHPPQESKTADQLETGSSLRVQHSHPEDEMTMKEVIEGYGHAVATLLTGDSFGSESLISGKPRAATIVCRQDTHLMCVSRNDYLSIAANSLVFDPASSAELLKKETDQRTPSEIEKLCRFVSPIPFFKQLEKSITYKLCRCMKLLKTRARHIVVMQGDNVDKHGGCFYILLKGTVSVHILKNRKKPDHFGLQLLMDKTPKDGDDHKSVYVDHMESLYDDFSQDGEGNHDLPLAREDPIPLQRLHDLSKVLGSCVALLRAGDSFGELGLHNNHDHEQLQFEAGTSSALAKSPKHPKKKKVGKRNASIVCRENCELLCIRREDFLSLLSKQKLHFNPSRAREIVKKRPEDRTEAEVQILVSLCEGLKFFSQIPRDLIRKCCARLTLESYKASDVVFEQGSLGESMYIVLSGFLELDIASGDEEYRDHQGHMSSKTQESQLEQINQRDEDAFRKFLELTILTKYSSKLKAWVKRAKERVADRSELSHNSVSVSRFRDSTYLDKNETLYESNEGQLQSHKMWSGVVSEPTDYGRKSFGTAVCVFKAGDAFGEMALLKDGVRNGTVICIREQAELLRLDKIDFKNILAGISGKIDFHSANTRELIVRAKDKGFSLLGSMQILTSITKGIPEFDILAENDREKLFSKLSVSYFAPDEYIYKRYEPARECFMLLDGSVCLEDASDSSFEISKKGTSFGQTGVLLHHTRAVSCRVSSEAKGAICLIVDSDTYHKMWKGRFDRHHAKILSCMIQRQTFGSKYDAREMSLISAAATAQVLPRGATFAHPGGKSYTCWMDSLLMIITGEVECLQESRSISSVSGTLVPTRPSSASHWHRRHKTRASFFKGLRPNVGNRVVYANGSSRGSSLAGPGMIIGQLKSSDHFRSQSIHSNLSVTNIRCTRESLIIGLKYKHLHDFLKSDTISNLKIRSNEQEEWIDDLRETDKLVRDKETKALEERKESVQMMPGKSAKDQRAHEARMRNLYLEKEKAARKQMQLNDPVNKGRSSRQYVGNIFLDADPKETAHQVMRKAAMVFELDKKKSVESLLSMSNEPSEKYRGTVFERTMNKLKSDKEYRDSSRKLSIKERWKRLGNKNSQSGSLLAPSARSRVAAGMTIQLATNKADHEKSAIRGNRLTISRLRNHTDERGQQNTHIQDRAPNYPQGRILALGQHRSAYLNAIFAQLGKKGIVSAEKVTRSRNSKGKSKKAKRNKKYRQRNSGKIASQSTNRTTMALRQRHTRNTGKKIQGVPGLFDSINFRSFIG